MKTIQLTENENGQQVKAAVGDTIEIQLDEVPTTGYKWEIADAGENKLRTVSDNYQLHEAAGIGGGGKKTIRFIADTAGSGKLKLVNRQPWSNDIYKTFEIAYSIE